MVYVRKAGQPSPRPCEPAELATEGGSVAVRAETLISRTPEGPFAPLPVALERDPALRDDLARSIPVPSQMAWSRVRLLVLGLAMVPLLMVVELDRELVQGNMQGTGRLLVDLLLAAYVVFELTRKTPRMPGVAAAALLAVGMRWMLVATRHCGKSVHPAVWVAAALAVATGLTVLARAPTRTRLALELLGKLGISRSEAEAVKRVAPPRGVVLVGASLAAAGLPLLLWALRRNGAGLWPQAIALVAYGVVVPDAVLRAAARVSRSSPAAEPARAPTPALIRIGETLFASALGLTLTAALLYGTHQFFDAGGELARCTGRLDEASRRLLAAEAAELSRRLSNVRASSALVLMSTAVMPLAEERIYRGLLMNTLVKRYGLTYGLFASAAAFGASHIGIYEVALYQTVLLGIGFGLAYAEGGLLAAFIVHAAWNILNLT